MEPFFISWHRHGMAREGFEIQGRATFWFEALYDVEVVVYRIKSQWGRLVEMSFEKIELIPTEQGFGKLHEYVLGLSSCL